MQRRTYTFTTWILLGMLCLSAFFPALSAAAATTTTSSLTLNAKAAIAIDAKTGKILYEKNAQTALPIASMTKMLSLYLVSEQIAQGKLKWTDTVTISDYVATMSADTNLSNVSLTKGSTHTVRDLYNASIIESANGAVLALADKVAGSETKFVDLMREKVKSWGITDAHLISATGLNNTDRKGQIYPGTAADDENAMSATDMAILARHLVLDYPEYLAVSKQSTLTFAAGTSDQTNMTNWDWMLPGLPNYKAGVDGLKTGTTDKAGPSFTGTIVQNNWRIITVIMNADKSEGESARFIETNKLMDYVYQNWSATTLLAKGSSLKGHQTAAVPKGKEQTVQLETQTDITGFIRKDMDASQLKTSFKSSGKKELTAPVKQGKTVGKVSVQLAQDDLGYLPHTTNDQSSLVVTKQAVAEADLWTRTKRSIHNFFQNLF